jgi:hypothetical protein
MNDRIEKTIELKALISRVWRAPTDRQLSNIARHVEQAAA